MEGFEPYKPLTGMAVTDSMSKLQQGDLPLALPLPNASYVSQPTSGNLLGIDAPGQSSP